MRTTVTLDSDSEALIRRQMIERRLSFKKALNDAIRRGLRPPGKSQRQSYRVKPFRSGYRSGVERERLNQLAQELETTEFKRARPRRK